MTTKVPPLPSGVALTAAAVAQERAVETARADGLVNDPWARTLVDAAVAAAPTSSPQWTLLANGVTPSAVVPAMTDYLPLRTRWLDDVILSAVEAGAGQVVVLGAGLDTRALRLAWSKSVHVFTIDQPAVMDFVQNVLASETPPPDVRWTPLSADLAGPWNSTLVKSGFTIDVATVWVLEGVLMYLSPEQNHALLATVRELSAVGSVMLADLAHPSILDGAAFAAGRQSLGDNGSPVRSAVGEPVSWYATHGWDARVVDPAALADTHDRAVPPVLDPTTPGGPVFWLTEAQLLPTTGNEDQREM